MGRSRRHELSSGPSAVQQTVDLNALDGKKETLIKGVGMMSFAWLFLGSPVAIGSVVFK